MANHLRVVALAASLGACKGEDPLERLCSQVFACGCQPAGYASESECAASLRLQAMLYAGIARGAGLVYDEACAAEAADQAEAQGCKSAADLAAQPAMCSACAAIHGDRPDGAACTQDDSFDFSDCDRHLVCLGGVCRDPCALVAAGGPCIDELGNTIGTCAEGTVCGSTTRTCVAQVGAGAACPNGSECEEGLRCDVGMCVAPPGAGEACPLGQCGAYLVCQSGTCAPFPEIGASCADFGSCAEGAYCDPRDRRCAALGRIGDACVGEGGCAAGGTCEDDVCVAQPAAFCSVD